VRRKKENKISVEKEETPTAGGVDLPSSSSLR